MTRVRFWQRDFPRDEFCDRLGIPAEHRPHLFTGYVNVIGVSIAFVHNVDEHTSDQWSMFFWKRDFCRKLGMPPEWARSLTRISKTYRDQVEVRFVGR